jgi:hypothetical protein
MMPFWIFSRFWGGFLALKRKEFTAENGIL